MARKTIIYKSENAEMRWFFKIYLFIFIFYFLRKTTSPTTSYCNEGSLRVQLIHFFILSLDCVLTMVLLFAGDIPETDRIVNTSY